MAEQLTGDAPRAVAGDGAADAARRRDAETGVLDPAGPDEHRHEPAAHLDTAGVGGLEVGPPPNVLAGPEPGHAGSDRGQRSSDTVSRFRPFARRRLMTWRPSLVAILTRKPWVFRRRRLFG